MSKNNQLKCIHCDKLINGKPYIHLNGLLLSDDDNDNDKYICGYVCYKRCIEKSKQNPMPNKFLKS